MKAVAKMPIPGFDPILNVLPPHLGDPTQAHDLSPYPCSITEMCHRFPTNRSRKEILTGLLELRAELLSLGIAGFQWVGGSFVEDIESQESREPKDIDVVTFVTQPADLTTLATILAGRPDLNRRSLVKARYRVDHFLLPLCSAPEHIVDQTRYWCGLFSHRRDHLWKGMLVVGLIDKTDDDAGRIVLGGIP